jgi:DNA-binding response OmpR family regulator
MRAFLERERHVVEVAAGYHDAMERVGTYEYDCLLLDIMLPDGDGLSLLAELKEMHRAENVIIISARGSTEDKVEGLELGADDYLAKPFHLAELGARIRSVARRKERGGERLIRLGNVEIDPDRFEVRADGKALELNRKEYDILCYFAGRPGLLVEKTTLAEAVWGDNIDQADNFDFIYAQVKNLRRKLREAGAGVEINAVYGFGYKLNVGL